MGRAVSISQHLMRTGRLTRGPDRAVSPCSGITLTVPDCRRIPSFKSRGAEESARIRHITAEADGFHIYFTHGQGFLQIRDKKSIVNYCAVKPDSKKSELKSES